MICLVLLLALISTCQSLINGNMDCTLANDYTDLHNHDACDNEDYDSAERIEKYGVGCYIKEAQHNMINFSTISRKIRFDDAAVSNTVEKLLMWNSCCYCRLLYYETVL